MKQEIDGLLAGDQKLQQFLAWVEEKSNSVEAPYKKAAVRAYYFALAPYPAQARYLAQARCLARYLVRDLDLDLDLTLDLALGLDLDLTLDLALALDRDLVRVLELTLEDELKRKLQQFKTELPNPKENFDIFKQWWRENGVNWTQKLKATIIEHRNIGHDWQFTKSQKELLEKYEYANKFLMECLNSDCYVSRDVRKQIEDTLLLPIKSIKQYNRPPAL
ncbi:hypothetical protein RIVM261_075990 [Rivularia sp. IAM M-261]|nr:hypothetical protein RIVM261_075990 [Rivularia sp. IAM M-261]